MNVTTFDENGVEILPEATVNTNQLALWYEKYNQLKKLKAEEITIRKAIFIGAFPNAKEGTNKYELPDDYVLTGNLPYTREVDEGALSAIRELLKENNVNVDRLFKIKHSLVKGEYTNLSEKNRAIVDQCLICKAGSPALEIKAKPAAKAKAKKASV